MGFNIAMVTVMNVTRKHVLQKVEAKLMVNTMPLSDLNYQASAFKNRTFFFCCRNNYRDLCKRDNIRVCKHGIVQLKKKSL
jgi:hypothetical protein